eukprot:Selendium_serpulae@DN6445_c1_g1_i2.p1
MDREQLDGVDSACPPGEAKGYTADELILALGSFLEGVARSTDQYVASQLNKIPPDERFITTSPELSYKPDLARQATLVSLECSDVFMYGDVDCDDDNLSAAKAGDGGAKAIGGAHKYPIAKTKGDNCETTAPPRALDSVDVYSPDARCLSEFEMADLPTALCDQTPLHSGTPQASRSDAGSDSGDMDLLRGSGSSESRQDLLGDQFFPQLLPGSAAVQAPVALVLVAAAPPNAPGEPSAAAPPQLAAWTPPPPPQLQQRVANVDVSSTLDKGGSGESDFSQIISEFLNLNFFQTFPPLAHPVAVPVGSSCDAAAVQHPQPAQIYPVIASGPQQQQQSTTPLPPLPVGEVHHFPPMNLSLLPKLAGPMRDLPRSVETDRLMSWSDCLPLTPLPPRFFDAQCTWSPTPCVRRMPRTVSHLQRPYTQLLQEEIQHLCKETLRQKESPLIWSYEKGVHKPSVYKAVLKIPKYRPEAEWRCENWHRAASTARRHAAHLPACECARLRIMGEIRCHLT